MKKARILALVVALLLLATMLCACGEPKAAKAEEILSGAYKTDVRMLSTQSQVDLGTFWEADDFYDDCQEYGLFALCDNSGEYDVVRIYNIVTGTFVHTFTEAQGYILDDLSYYKTQIYGLSLFTILTGTVAEDGTISYNTSLYTANGDLVASVAREATVEVYLDLFEFNGVVYRATKDGGWSKAFDKSDLVAYDTTNIHDITENYYYSTDTTNGELFVYDKEMKLVASYTAPSYGNVNCFGVLKDGVVLVQYTVKQPEDATKYDIFESGDKMNVVTELFSVEKQKTSELKLDYLVVEFASRSMDPENETFCSFSDEVEAVIGAVEIKDGRVDLSTAGMKALTMNGKGKIVASISDMFEGMGGTPRPVATDRYVYYTLDDRAYMIDREGNVLGEVTGISRATEKYIIGESKIYNYDLSVAYDYGTEGMELLRETPYSSSPLITNGVVFLKKAGETYLFNGTLVKLIAKDETTTKSLTVKKDYFVVTDTSDPANVIYTYYSATGAQLLSSTTGLDITNIFAEYEGIYLFKGITATGEKVYYRFA